MRAVTLIPLVMLLAGCATTAPPPPPPAAGEVVASQDETVVEEVIDVDPESDVVCAWESRTGTHRKEKRCYTRAQLDEIQTKSKEMLRTRAARGTVYVPIHPEDPRNRKKTGN